MRRINKIVGACISAVLLTACGGNGPALFPTSQTSVSPLGVRSDGESILYYFQGHRRADGENAEAGLIVVNGKLYGTTAYGGGEKSCENKLGCGTVFEVTPSGVEQVLYRFKDAPDGNYPAASLIQRDGLLYGTTTGGGKDHAGTVFTVNPATGVENVVYSFRGATAGDGNTPNTLIAVKGVLYGTTSSGGSEGCGTSYAQGCGTVFELTPAGNERVLYRFKGGGDDHDRDGGHPVAGLTFMNGLLYGTTSGGGRYRKSVRECLIGCGTVFAISPSGDRYRTLYRFQGGQEDGAEPNATLIENHGALYGTTERGGSKAVCGGYTCGTVFRVSTSGAERLLHHFGGEADGFLPTGLIAVDGTFYGTTSLGDPRQQCLSSGCGTVFKISPAGGDYRVLHAFVVAYKVPDGVVPVGTLAYLNGVLYGTTYWGKLPPVCYDDVTCGPGTIFKVMP